jgi:MFS family permease
VNAGGGEPQAAVSAATGYRPVLYTLPFVGLCIVAFLGFAQNFTLQPILPLLVFDLGGDATMVGIVFAVFSIPSIALRPHIGRLADRLGSRRVLAIGTAGIGLAGPIYLVSSLPLVLLNRVVHGTAWAAFNTGGASTMARLAPAERRGEASGIYDLMPGLAILVMPSVALLLYAQTGLVGPLLIATGLGLAATAAVFLLIPDDGLARADRRSESGGGLLEPSAVLPMTFQLLLTAAVSLFVVYPPVLAAARGIPLSDLAVYYPIYGLTLVLVRAASGRFLDRFPRSVVIAAGASFAAAGLLIAATATSVLVLTVGGVLYAAAAGFTSPAMMALVMDHSPPARLGSAMATYTLGFQFGSGLGAALWGLLIDSVGFPWPFLVAAGLQLAMLLIVIRLRPTLARRAPI